MEKATEKNNASRKLAASMVNLTGWDNDDNSGIKSFANVVLQQGPWMIRNTPSSELCGPPILPLAKDGSQHKVPVWVKFHRVPVVAYSEDGLIPLENGEGYSKENIRVEYEWKPPTCIDCRVFGHNTDKCPKKPVVCAPAMVCNTSGGNQ
ncbi:reverse transcriptase domain-containing protein [Tanacetum coccineum]